MPLGEIPNFLHRLQDVYYEAVNEMLVKTSTVTAPWTIVEGESKWHARIKVLKTLVDGLSRELNFDPFAERKSDNGDKKKPKEKKKKKAMS